MKDLPGSPFLGLAAAARGGVGPGGNPNTLEGFPGGLPGALGTYNVKQNVKSNNFLVTRLA